MKDYTKLCVYAICKNESKFIDRWIGSLQGEADCVVVLDTGSSDDSVEKLKKYEPFVTVRQFDYMKEVGYFRFDKARNDSLKLVPFDADICVVLDIDQVPRKGWGALIKKYFSEGYHEVKGKIIDHDESGQERNEWMSKNVHPNSGMWVWEKVIHEGIKYRGSDIVRGIYDENFVIDHYPDETKDRSLYRDLLEYACKEYPKDPYYGIFLGIELSRRYDDNLAKDAFRRCLDECDFTDQEDIHIQTLINMSNYEDDYNKAIELLKEAERLGGNTRRLYYKFADIYEKMERYDDAIDSLKHALLIESNSNDWKDDDALFHGLIEDRLSLFYYYRKKDILTAIEYSCKALKLDPDSDRLLKNFRYYVSYFLESEEKQ